MPHRKSHRLVVDSNVWISYLLTKLFAKLNELISSGTFRLLYSEALLLELADVLERPKIKTQIGPADVAELFKRIREQGTEVMVTSVVEVCRDPNDDKILELCKDGKAELLVTGDKDLLVLKKFGRTLIMSPLQFLEKYK